MTIPAIWINEDANDGYLGMDQKIKSLHRSNYEAVF